MKRLTLQQAREIDCCPHCCNPNGMSYYGEAVAYTTVYANQDGTIDSALNELRTDDLCPNPYFDKKGNTLEDATIWWANCPECDWILKFHMVISGLDSVIARSLAKQITKVLNTKYITKYSKCPCKCGLYRITITIKDHIECLFLCKDVIKVSPFGCSIQYNDLNKILDIIADMENELNEMEKKK